MIWYADGTLAEALGAVRCVREMREEARTALEIEAENGRLVMEPLGPAGVYLSAEFSDGELSDGMQRGGLLEGRLRPAAPFTWEETDGSIIIRCGLMEVHAERDPLRLRFLSPEGRVLVEEIAGGGLRRGPWLRSWHLSAAEGEAFYGVGYAGASAEAPRSLNGRGRTWPVFAGAGPIAGLPVLLSSRRYGLLVSAAGRGYWDVEAGRPGEIAYVTHSAEFEAVFFTAGSLMELVNKAAALYGGW
ncbi:MAG: hypothetical protein ACUVT1_09355, partial [Anaerolineae bacterium]